MLDRRRTRSIIVFLILVVVMPLLLVENRAFADVSSNALTKFEAYGLHMCIVNRFKQSFSADEIAGNDDYDDFMVGGTKELIKEGLDDNYVSLPAGHGLSGDDSDKISCSKLSSNLIGEGSDNDKNPYSGFTDLLDKFGYEKQESTGKSKCVKYKFQYILAHGSEFHDAGYIEYCESSVNDNGSISSDSIPTAKRYGNETREDDGGVTLHIGYIDVSSSDKVTFCADSQEEDFSAEDCDKYDDDFKGSISRSSSWGEITSGLSNKIKDVYSALGKSAMGDGDSMFDNHTLSPEMVWLKYDTYEAAPSGSATSNSGFSYDIKSPLNTFYTAYKNLFGVDYSPYNFDKSQQAALYQNYILSYWEADSKACADTKEASLDIGSHDLLLGDDDDDREYHQTKLYKSDGSAQYCYVKTEKYGDKVYGIEHGLPAGEKIGFAAVAKWLLDDGPDSISPEDVTSSTSGSDGSDGSSGNVEATCGNSGGAESLGWIVCPILEWMRKAAEDVYNNALEPALNVEPKLFTEGGATHDAWESFRNIANILFTILFLIVIFSQLTGVGIDNYGIKKILPKLIIVAVLINLSYLICIICVDLSNIIGNGLHGFFDGLNAGTMNAELSAKIQGSGAGATTLTAVVLLFVLGGGFLVVWKNPGILIALLVGALGVVIAIFFVFILLAAREAAIVVLTVISPLAVVCYMLPNAKKLFDRWMKFWEGLLLLYPICGALIGGGNFVSKLLLSTGLAAQGFWSAFVAMIVGVMPIFFIPTVLKSSFAAMGAIGAKITGFGDRMRSGATRGMRNSNLYQDAQKRSQARNQRISARRRAGIKVDKDGNVVESRRPTARLRRRMAGTWAGRRLGMEAAMGQSAAAFLQQESARRNDIESLNMDAANVQFIKDANAREQRRAEASVGVARISQDTAMQRARASREAQALKAFQDQYANMSRDQLRAEAGGITSWRGSADGSQRASALISAMESRGMENDIYSMLERDNSIHGDSAVMSTLAGSKNKVLKAFGKTSSTDFASFMSGTGAGSMQGYISGKGREFLNGIDDKSLGAIAARNSDALSTGLLAEAAASLDNADALAAVNDMLRNRSDVTMSGAQLASYNAATIAAIQQSGGRNIDALLKASDDIAADPKLVNKLDTNTRGMINAIRTANGRSGI